MNLSHARRLCCPRHERGSVADPCIRPLHLIRRRSGLALSITPAAGESVFVWTADAYDVFGLAPGTVVTVDAVLDFEGWIGTPGCGGPDCAATFRAMVFGEFFDSRRELDAPARAGQVSERSSLATPVRLTVGQRNVVGCFLAIRIAPGGYHEGQ